MEQIIINGVDLSALKGRFDAIKVEMEGHRSKIREEAAKHISDGIDKTMTLVKELIELEDADEINKVGKEALDTLTTVSFVAEVSGIPFLLPYYEEYGRYNYEDTITGMLEDYDNDAIESAYDKSDVLRKLVQLASGMESQALGWHSSTC